MSLEKIQASKSFAENDDNFHTSIYTGCYHLMALFLSCNTEGQVLKGRRSSTEKALAV